jgi:hypothetical protein
VKTPVDFRQMSRPDHEPVVHLSNEDLMPLPAPFDGADKDKPWNALSQQVLAKYECGLDNTCAVSLPQPKTAEDEKELVAKFLSGLEKLFTKENNWTFLQPLLLTMEHCTHCQTDRKSVV